MDAWDIFENLNLKLPWEIDIFEKKIDAPKSIDLWKLLMTWCYAWQSTNVLMQCCCKVKYITWDKITEYRHHKILPIAVYSALRHAWTTCSYIILVSSLLTNLHSLSVSIRVSCNIRQKVSFVTRLSKYDNWFVQNFTIPFNSLSTLTVIPSASDNTIKGPLQQKSIHKTSLSLVMRSVSFLLSWSSLQVELLYSILSTINTDKKQLWINESIAPIFYLLHRFVNISYNPNSAYVIIYIACYQFTSSLINIAHSSILLNWSCHTNTFLFLNPNNVFFSFSNHLHSPHHLVRNASVCSTWNFWIVV